MAYNERKVIRILMDELDAIQQRHPNYHSAMGHLLAKVLKLEGEHKRAKTNVVQKIGREVNKVGKSLHEARTDNVL